MGSLLTTRAVQKHMVNAKFGRIINISSTASSTAALGKSRSDQLLRGQAGLQGFTCALVTELGPFVNTANSVAPGFIPIEMTAATAERLGTSFDEFKAVR